MHIFKLGLLLVLFEVNIIKYISKIRRHTTKLVEDKLFKIGGFQRYGRGICSQNLKYKFSEKT